jgi:hypothetical protein
MHLKKEGLIKKVLLLSKTMKIYLFFALNLIMKFGFCQEKLQREYSLLIGKWKLENDYSYLLIAKNVIYEFEGKKLVDSLNYSLSLKPCSEYFATHGATLYMYQTHINDQDTTCYIIQNLSKNSFIYSSSEASGIVFYKKVR